MKKSDNIFIAGHNGLVGSSIFNLLKNKGYKNLITVNRKNLDLRNSSKRTTIGLVFTCLSSFVQLKMKI